MARVVLKNLWKSYPGAKNVAPAVQDFQLDIADREFVALIGPSGCGKSTTLRMIAGLESATQGEIYIDDQLVNDLSPKKRNISMVFQNYALYPSLSNFENIAFALRVGRAQKYIIEESVKRTARKLEIDHLLDRYPREVSGGQRQRVALGRAIVRDPRVFLMDEPLSNLDAKMRVQMRLEIIKLHRSLHATTIYVTHDQIEAMTMADRIVIMNKGVIQQVGTPEEIYNYPANTFVGGFIGNPPMNFINGTIEHGRVFSNKTMGLQIPRETGERLQEQNVHSVIGGIRPEQLYIEMGSSPVSDHTFVGTVDVTELIGADRHVHVDLGKTGTVVVRTGAETRFREGDTVTVKANMDKFLFFDPNTGCRIH
ncbi:ABC transporter ATP-binding protein [Paenibacillus sp. GCM10027626]|uniref:ABC transporter ATP-binding protein n=1 Tax=Paenibacillus sp. GCM10027626 TaxID=3273411 RepID=UPI003625BAF7